MTSGADQKQLLVYEPRTEGHHLGWLRFITEDLLTGGMKLTLAVDRRPKAVEKIREELGPLLSQVTLLGPEEPANAPEFVGRGIKHVAHCLAQSGAANVFLCAWDEVASHIWRNASLGIYPPKELRGRMGGIYHRPRFLEQPWWSPRRWLKPLGFRRIVSHGWLRQLLFVDEYLARDLQKKFPGAPISFLCDPCPPAGGVESLSARKRLALPHEQRIFLFYGGGYRRKGLAVAVEAMRQMPQEIPAFLLCVGQLNPEGAVADGLEQLERAGRAKLINRYVTAEEEQLAFAASDVVLLPYLHHFGTSGVLSRAMAAGRMVIVSDEELLGRLTRQHGLGWLFPTGDARELGKKMAATIKLSPVEWENFAQAASKYAAIYSRAAYRKTLLETVCLPG